ncbi:unnamed protein product [Paramecium pentaurelia]|uniref:Transmembrane protein n=1 Tax=Paramecium pentaurelia TaxID=43138 RepID=A0A8S1XC23_9CILI|nr:unnamed protein product [Paramecium pentaurelia]
MQNIDSVKIKFLRILIKHRFVKRFLGKQKLTEQSYFTVNQGALACFSELCQSLSCNNRIIEVNLSGCNINVYFAIELANLVQKNTNIEVLQLASCKLNSFSLSCIFKAMIDHTGLAQLNLFNNQSFTPTVVQDFIKYVLKGKNPLIEINISHCNIENAQLSMILPNLKNLKSLKRLKMGLMSLSSESLLALSSAMLHYTGKRYLDYLDLSFCQIKNHGLELLNKSLYLSVITSINIKSLNLSGNHISQDGVVHLEQILLKLNIEELNLSRNKIQEFQNQQVLNKQLVRVDLSSNLFEEIPNNFFLNVLSINLSNNQINTQGAYQISQVLSYKKVQWVELNINNNCIKTRGFISLIYALIENKSLTNLSVANNKINGEGILVYIFNHEQLNLQYLDLSHNYLRYDLVYALISMMKECKLKTLVLSQLRQDENEIHSGKNELFEIKCANLREIDFSCNPQIIMPILKSLSKQYNRLEYLNLNNCQLIKKPERESQIKKSDTQTLDRRKSGEIPVKKSDTFTIDLKKSTEAKFLVFDEHVIIDQIEQKNSQQQNSQVLECIYNLLSKTYTLQTLCLANNNLHYLNENELKHLESCFANNFTLVSLDLSNNKLKSKIVFLVNGLKNCGSLRYLNISNNQIEEDYEVIIKLPEIFKNPSLQYIDLSQNSIHSATFQNMKKILLRQYKQFPQMNLSQLKLTADDLVSISEIIHESYSIRKLELFGNQSIDYSNNVMVYGDNNKVESLSINRLKLRRDIFENLFQILVQNSKWMRIIEISNTLLKNYQLKKLLEQLKQMHFLKALIMDNQYFDSKEVIDSMKELYRSFKKLKTLSIRKSTLSFEFFEFLYQLLINSKKLEELDLSSNQSNDYEHKCIISKQCIELLSQGIQNNQTLKNLNLSKCQLDDEVMQIFIDTLPLNNSLIQLDISECNLTKLSFLRFKQNFSQNPSLLQKLCCQLMIDEIPNNFVNSQSLPNLFYLDISKNKQKNRSINKLVQCCQPNNIFQNLFFLNLEQCHLNDHHCKVLSKLIVTNLKELDLSQNQITFSGFKDLFDPILEGKSKLKALNLSKNKINEEYFCQLEYTEFNMRIESLELLSLDGNLCYGKGCKGFIKLLSQNPKLYIFNHWVNINDQLAYLVIQSYIQFTQLYNLKYGQYNYIQQLIIKETDFSDDFLIWFGYNYFQLPYLQYIDFSGNSRFCTSMGKMHMYINMINNQVNYNLLQVKFDEVEQQTLTMFDDGLIRYHLLKQKFRFQNYTIMQSSYGINDQNIETIKWGFIGKFIIHIINKLLYVFQGSLTEFRMSSQLQKHLRRKMNRMKIYYILGCLVEPVFLILALLTAFMLQTPLSLQDLQDHRNCRNQYCFINDVQILTLTLFIIDILVIVMCSVTNLIIAIKLRINSEPDFYILTYEQKKELKRKFPIKKELLLLMLQIVLQCKYIFDTLIISSSYNMSSYIEKYEDNSFQQIRTNFLATAYMMTIMICIKFTIFCYQDLKCTIQFFKHPNRDASFLLSNLWMKNIYDTNILVENVISNFCPQSGIKIMNSLFNLKQIYQLTQLFVIELPTFFIYLFFFNNYQLMFSKMGYQTVITVTIIFQVIGMLRNIIKGLCNTYWALVSRPPIVKWFDINEFLLLRRYQHLGEKRLITQQPIKQKKQFNNTKSIMKKKLIHNQQLTQKSKSERIIEKRKTSRRASSDHEEEADCLVKKNQMTTENMYIGTLNTKMKSD